MGEALAGVAVNRYPDPAAPALKARLREAMAMPEGLELVLGNGSDELIQIVCARARACPAPWRSPRSPRFVMYAHERASPRACDSSACRSPATSRSTRRRCWPRSQPHRPRSSGSPTPTIPPATSSRREAILRSSRRPPGLVVVDEAYHAFSAARSSWTRWPPSEPRAADAHRVASSASRALRLGLAVGPGGTGSPSSRSCARPTT